MSHPVQKMLEDLVEEAKKFQIPPEPPDEEAQKVIIIVAGRVLTALESIAESLKALSSTVKPDGPTTFPAIRTAAASE